ncbi:IclR family transcriptional regulator [Desulfitibacter alkalitolerans]|uniref:IclR family transcriptional regulator n=1 Tax=Desulfitibacter alkalitolerans TaxID=264641 RepID=UPI0004898C68|nr:IclR family transcriptional regulator [Desulfitibacter alkalitolerans]
MIDSVARALQILSYLADNNEVGVRELSRIFEVNEATAYRTLNTLQKHGYVIQDMKTKKYRLGFETVRIGQSCLSSYDLVQVARKYSIELSRRINETVILMSRHGRFAVYVNKIESPHVVRIHSQIGSKIPINFGGFTKPIFVFLNEREQRELIGDKTYDEIKSQIQEFKTQGYTISDEEVDSGVLVLGCPVYNYEADIIGALNIPIPKIRLDEEKLPCIAEDLLKTSRDISQELGYRV